MRSDGRRGLGSQAQVNLRSPTQPLAFLSGPSFARELLLDLPTAVVVAAADEALRLRHVLPRAPAP